jgi:Zn-dependent protease
MLKFSIFSVPVVVDWWFWITTILLGGGASAHGPDDWTRVAIWTGVVFVSILVHELGHAFAGSHFGAAPFIRLQGFGGVTFLPHARFTRTESILVSAAGPAAGLTLGLITFAVGTFLTGLPPLARWAVDSALYVNFVWTLINLLPIQPLDGGQIFGQVLGPDRARMTSWIGFAVACGLCLWALEKGLLFSAMMLAMLAYYNFRRVPVAGGVVTGD